MIRVISAHEAIAPDPDDLSPRERRLAGLTRDPRPRGEEAAMAKKHDCPVASETACDRVGAEGFGTAHGANVHAGKTHTRAWRAHRRRRAEAPVASTPLEREARANGTHRVDLTGQELALLMETLALLMETLALLMETLEAYPINVLGEAEAADLEALAVRAGTLAKLRRAVGA